MVEVHLDMREAMAMGEHFMASFEKHLIKEFNKVLTMALKVAQDRAPVGRSNYLVEGTGPNTAIKKVPGGTLRRSLTAHLQGQLEDVLEGRIGVAGGSPAEKYARMRELGGVIEAKKSRMLRFSPDGKHIVFKRVVHQEPHPYLLPALIFAWPYMQRVPELAFEAAKAEHGL